MNKTQIEWVKNPDGSQGYTWNPITGCLNHDNGLCKGGGFRCYAYKLAHGRVKHLYLNNLNVGECPDREIEILAQDQHPFYPRFWEERLYHPWGGKPKGIFVCDMSDLFGIGIPEEWTQKVLNLCRLHEQNRYYLLTKQAQRLPEFSPFPENCFVGVTACNWKMAFAAFWELQDVKAPVKYISFEPLLDSVGHRELEGWLSRASISWLIIGACTGTKSEIVKLHKSYPSLDIFAPSAFATKLKLKLPTYKWTLQPKIEWVQEIVEAADKAGVKVFLKDNLRPLLENDPLNPLYWANVCNDEAGNERVDDSLRQEMPEG